MPRHCPSYLVDPCPRNVSVLDRPSDLILPTINARRTRHHSLFPSRRLVNTKDSAIIFAVNTSTDPSGKQLHNREHHATDSRSTDRHDRHQNTLPSMRRPKFRLSSLITKDLRCRTDQALRTRSLTLERFKLNDSSSPPMTFNGSSTISARSFSISLLEHKPSKSSSSRAKGNTLERKIVLQKQTKATHMVPGTP